MLTNDPKNGLSHSLYYESHVTIAPVTGLRLELFKQLCSIYEFRVAKLIMEKPGERKDAFCTGRSKSIDRLFDMMHGLLNSLREKEFEVYRYKIENCILDEKFK
jgi:hypothetical protein